MLLVPAAWSLLVEHHQRTVHRLFLPGLPALPAVRPVLLAVLLGVVDQCGEGLSESSRPRGAEAQVAQGQLGLYGGAVQLLGDRREHRGGTGRLRFGDDHVAGRALVVLLGAAAYLAGLRDVDEPGLAEHLEVVGDVALLRVELGREPADGGGPVAQGEEQSLPQRVGERRELLGRADLQDVLGRR